MDLIYICDGDVSVFEAQVLEFVSHLQSRGNNVALLLGYKNKKEQASYLRKLERYPNITLYWKISFPMYPCFEKKALSSLYASLYSIPHFRNSVIHVRNGYLGYLMKKTAINHHLTNRIVIDIRGIVLEELKYKYSSSSLLRKAAFIVQMKYLQKVYAYLFHKDDFTDIVITSVSPKINDYIRKYFPEESYSLFVHPNIAGSQFVFDQAARNSIRRELGVSDDELLAICSSNGAALWQKDYEIISRLSEIGFRVINLSKSDNKIKDCITITVPFAQMPEMLSAADVAVLWRDDVVMNQVASPSKFSEFASMGIYVIHNATVHLAAEYIRSTGCGILVNDVEDITLDKFNRHEITTRRKARINVGVKTFGIHGIAESYSKLYRK